MELCRTRHGFGRSIRRHLSRKPDLEKQFEVAAEQDCPFGLSYKKKDDYCNAAFWYKAAVKVLRACHRDDQDSTRHERADNFEP